MPGRRTWQVFGFHLKPKQRDPKPCAWMRTCKENCPRYKLESVSLLSLKSSPWETNLRHSKYHCMVPTLPLGWKSDTSHPPKKQSLYLHQGVNEWVMWVVADLRRSLVQPPLVNSWGSYGGYTHSSRLYPIKELKSSKDGACTTFLGSSLHC